MAMQMIRTSSELSEPIVAHERNRLRAAMTPASDPVGRPASRPRDQTGVRHGDKYVRRTTTWLPRRVAIVVELVNRGIRTAIDRAARKLLEGVRRRITRRRSGAQSSPGSFPPV